MLTLNEFRNLDVTDKLDYLYEVELSKYSAEGQSPISPIFNRESQDISIVKPLPNLPFGFVEIFGDYSHLPYGNGTRVEWERNAEKFVPAPELIQNKIDYYAKNQISIKEGIGSPFSFYFAGVPSVGFSEAPDGFFKPLSMYESSYLTMVGLARNSKEKK